MSDSLIEQFGDIVGSEHVLTDDESRAFYSHDVFYTGLTAAAVVQPSSPEEVAQIVGLATANNKPIIPRGGGLSYTKGYVPQDDGAIVLDTRRLDQVIDVNADDLVVTVEAGCTWEALLHETRKAGLRPCQFGPSTGRVSTIGGTLSQNAMFFGSARHGTAADSVIGLDVVLADGSLVSTGTNGLEYGKPFFRYHGPDLTGLFIGDCGALGVKTAASLRLEPIPTDIAFGSFVFSNIDDMIDAAGHVARAGLASECLGLAPLTMDGRPDPDAMPALHLVVEGENPGDAERRRTRLIEPFVASANETEAMLPQLIREDPFGFVQGLLDAQGRLQIWTHGIFPPSAAQEAYREIASLLASHQDQFQMYKIGVTLSLAIAGPAIVLEPVFVWRDSIRPIHKVKFDSDQSMANLEAGTTTGVTKIVAAIREELRDLYMELGAAHMQIGKFYAYRDGLHEATFDAMKSLKAALDPKGLMNPGALDL